MSEGSEGITQRRRNMSKERNRDGMKGLRKIERKDVDDGGTV